MMAGKKGVSYCGLVCDKCIRGDEGIPKKAGQLLRSMDESELDQWHQKMPRDEAFSYGDLKKGLKWLEKHMHCAGCRAGGGNPECKIRNCTREKGFANCGECAKMPCSTIKETGVDAERNFAALRS